MVETNVRTESEDEHHKGDLTCSEPTLAIQYNIILVMIATLKYDSPWSKAEF